MERREVAYARRIGNEGGELHGFRCEGGDFLEDEVATRGASPPAALVLLGEQHRAREKLVNDAPQRPEIRRRRRQSAVQHLRRDVRARAAEGVAAAARSRTVARRGGRGLADLAEEEDRPEVRQRDVPRVLEKDVLRLEVAVHGVLDVAEVVQRQGDLGKQRNRELPPRRKTERWGGGSTALYRDSL